MLKVVSRSLLSKVNEIKSWNLLTEVVSPTALLDVNAR